jgi:hypothetical protein
MLNPDTLAWRDHLILTREIELPGERAVFYDSVRRGEFVSLRRGVYAPASHWTQLDVESQYRLRVLAAAAYVDGDIVVSHVSAASLWRLPWFSPYPRGVHALDPFATGGRSTSLISRHTVGLPRETEFIDGVRVTSLTRTVVDVARSTTFGQAVAVADAALRRASHPREGLPPARIEKADLLREVSLLSVAQGTAKARRVIQFADGLADRPGESISRVHISMAKLTAPQLQASLMGASGRLWHVDFWWPDFNLIGEFDGRAKYTDEEFLRGRSPQEVLYDEKLREDDLRAADHGFTRWPWSVAISMRRLRAHLVSAGLR